MNRRAIFDALRKLLGRPFKPSEVLTLDKALDDAGVARDDAADWCAYAMPLIERWESMARLIPGDKVQAYPDPGTGGKPWTIGVGSTTDEQGRPIKPGDVWTVDRARARFKAHLLEFAAGVDRLLGDAPATARQRAAMISLAYNIGLGAFSRSTVLRRHIAGDYAGAADAFAMWNRAGGRVLPGLTRRRGAEAQLYREGSV